MKVRARELKIIIIQLIILLINLYFVIIDSETSFHFWCVCGTVDITLLSIVLFWHQKAMFTAINMFWGSFCLFQFGLPILYAFNSNYYNYYINLFNDTILCEAAKYSTIAIIIASIAVTCCMLGEHKNLLKEGKFARLYNSNASAVSQFAFILFILCTLIIVPITAITALKQIMSGAYTIANRGVMVSNPLLRFVQEFFYSSGLLFLCFSNNRTKKKIVKILFACVCINMLLLADRAFGLVGLLVLAYFNMFIDGNSTSSKKKKAKNNMLFIGALGVIALIMATVAIKRQGGDSVFGALFNNILSEFGFNFTSICFVLDYVPGIDSFKYGLTYLVAFLRLIPSSIDFLGILSDPSFVLGETWLLNMNNTHGRSYLNFGVGFSLIAESYVNFAWFGLIFIFIIVFLVAKLLREKTSSPWRNYILSIMLFDLMLLPRRQFATLLKSVEYAILLMGLLLYLYISTRGKKKNNV